MPIWDVGLGHRPPTAVAEPAYAGGWARIAAFLARDAVKEFVQAVLAKDSMSHSLATSPH